MSPRTLHPRSWTLRVRSSLLEITDAGFSLGTTISLGGVALGCSATTCSGESNIVWSDRQLALLGGPEAKTDRALIWFARLSWLAALMTVAALIADRSGWHFLAAIPNDNYRDYALPLESPIGRGPFVPWAMEEEEWVSWGNRLLSPTPRISPYLRAFGPPV